jgi:hypothetical protein
VQCAVNGHKLLFLFIDPAENYEKGQSQYIQIPGGVLGNSYGTSGSLPVLATSGYTGVFFGDCSQHQHGNK